MAHLIFALRERVFLPTTWLLWSMPIISRMSRNFSCSLHLPLLTQLRMDCKGNTYFCSLCVTGDMCFNKAITTEVPYSLSWEHHLRKCLLKQSQYNGPYKFYAVCFGSSFILSAVLYKVKRCFMCAHLWHNIIALVVSQFCFQSCSSITKYSYWIVSCIP